MQRLLVMLANGFVQLHDWINKGNSIQSPYPITLQQGMHKLAAYQLAAGQSPIGSLQDLLNIAHCPLETWEIPLNGDEDFTGEKFLDKGMPTDFCFDWVHEGGPDALEEETLLMRVLKTCREENDPDAYTKFRACLIQRPVMTTLELQEAKRDFSSSTLREMFSMAYEAVPLSAAVDGQYGCCARCGGLMLRLSDNMSEDDAGFVCENEQCRLLGTLPEEFKTADEGVLWLSAGLRRYVARPGIPEILLKKELKAIGAEVDMWPNFDAYDLRARVGNEIWAIDVKDWANPFLLAQNAGPIRRTPHWDRAFYVFPDERQRPPHTDYLRAFESRWQRPPQTEAFMMRDFIYRVKQKLVLSHAE